MIHLFLETTTAATASPSASPTPATFGANVVTVAFLLSVLTWGPVVMAAVMALVPERRVGHDHRFLGIAFWTNMFALAILVIAYQQFQSYTGGLQFEEYQPWLPAWGIGYHMGVDGIGMALLLLNGLIGVASVLASWDVRERDKTYFILLLLTQAAVTGVIVSRDLFMLILFWAASGVPIAILAAGWGGAKRQAVATKLVVYWGLGTAALIGGILVLYTTSQAGSFDLGTLGTASLTTQQQMIVAVLLSIAALSRLPLVPLHSWARDLWSEAPAGVVVLVAGGATRLGGYVLVRLVAGILHDATRTIAPYLGALAALTIIYAVLAALSTTDLRRLAAYLALIPGAVTVLGVAGLTPLSIVGSVMLLFAGGLAAALMAGVGATLADRAQARGLTLAAGLAGRVPKLTWLLLIAGLAVLGVPFLATWVSSLMVFMGAFRYAPGATFAAAIGLVLGAAAVGRLMWRVAFGAPNPDAPTPHDATLADAWYLGILVGGLLWVGLLPGGPKLLGVPILDPGLANTVNTSTSDLASSYATTPSPSPSPSATPSASPSPSVSP